MFRFWRLACVDINSPVGRDSFQLANTPEVRRDAMQALEQAADRLHKQYGKVAVAWGQIKRLRRGRQEWPLSGDGLGALGMDTLRATAGEKFNDQHKLIARGGQCVTSVVLLTTPPTIRSIVAYGQSSKPGSKHYADQAPLFSAERFRRVAWTREQLADEIESMQELQYVLER